MKVDRGGAVASPMEGNATFEELAPDAELDPPVNAAVFTVLSTAELTAASQMGGRLELSCDFREEHRRRSKPE